MRNSYFDQVTGLPHDLRPDSAWVCDEGIGRCGRCTYRLAFNENNGWDATTPAARTLARLGYEPCGDEWCSDCDRPTEWAEQVQREAATDKTPPTTGCRRWGHHRNPNHGHCNRCGQEV